MSDHRSEEQEYRTPSEADSAEHCQYCTLTSNEYVGEESAYDDEHTERSDGVRGCDEHILQTSFTLKKSGETPVGNYPQAERNEN